MKAMKFLVSLLLVLTLALGAAQAGGYRGTGKPLNDFTVATIDGGTFTLSEILKEKKAVLINLWATWCLPCEMEFPYLQAAYEQYRDEVEIIALSVEPEDTPAVLAAYAESHGLAFPIGSDSGVGLGDIFVTSGIPTTVLVDRFGCVVLVGVGAQTSATPFLYAFDLLTSDRYTETVVLNTFPKNKPDVEAPAVETLAAAIGLTDGSIALSVSKNPYAWPFVPSEIDGIACLASTNAGKPDSVAELLVYVDAAEGDALTFSFRLSADARGDRFIIRRNGEAIKHFRSETGWVTYAIPLEAGENVISLSYNKNASVNGGEDALFLADFALVHGEEADAAVASAQAGEYPYAAETRIDVLNESAREIGFFDAAGRPVDLCSLLDCEAARYYIVPEETIRFTARLSHVMESDDMVLYGSSKNWGAKDLLDGELTEKLNYRGDAYINLVVYDSYAKLVHTVAFIFPDEDAVHTFEALLAANGVDVSFRDLDAEAAWTVRFIDQDGAPVSGCIVNFCTDETCVTVISDENGVASFRGVPYAYHLQVIRVPGGYAFDTAQEFTADEYGGELTLTVTRL